MSALRAIVVADERDYRLPTQAHKQAVGGIYVLSDNSLALTGDFGREV